MEAASLNRTNLSKPPDPDSFRDRFRIEIRKKRICINHNGTDLAQQQKNSTKSARATEPA